MTYNSNQDILGNFIVMQDGEVDLSYAEAHDKAIRSHFLAMYAKHTGIQTIEALTNYMKVAARFAGETTLLLFEAAAEEGRR